MGKIEFGTLYPFDVQPAGAGRWEVVDHRTSARQRFANHDAAVQYAMERKNNEDALKKALRDAE